MSSLSDMMYGLVGTGGSLLGGPDVPDPSAPPELLTINGVSLMMVVPSKTYQKGVTIAIFKSGGMMESPDALKERAAPLGEPWLVPGWPGIGVRLGAAAVGSDVIWKLSGRSPAVGHDWSGFAAVVIPPNLAEAGIALSTAGGSASSLWDFGNWAIGAIGGTAKNIVTAATVGPYIIVGAVVLAIGGVTIYFATKAKGKR